MFRKIVAAAALAVALGGFTSGVGVAHERAGGPDLTVNGCIGVCWD
ncbi:hypothetical protein ABTZ99_40390 [Actinosynnema sp. NPDC002837]